MIVLDRSQETPLYIQLYEALKSEITSGAIEDGSKLPPIRTLADELDVSRNTVEMAYQQLTAEGYVTSRSGSRYRVENTNHTLHEPKDNMSKIRQTAGSTQSALKQAGLLCGKTLQDECERSSEHQIEFDFAYGNRSEGSFPSRLWITLVSEALDYDQGASSRYSDPFGEIELRQIIAQNLNATRGVQCDPEQVIIQPGTQEAVDALTVLFDASYDTVAIENPGYDGVRRVFENRRFHLVPLDVASTPERFRESLEASNATIAFITPSNQFPTGKILPLDDRLAILKWAAQNGTYLLEDDYCREYRYVGNPIPSLQSLDTNGRVIYLGTLSKMLSPALRMSYIVLPHELLEVWQNVYSNYYCPVPWINQQALLLFGKQGHWDRYVRKAFVTYRTRRNILIDTLQATMGDRIQIIGGEAGLHVLVSTNDSRTQQELIQAAAEKGVGIYPTHQYWMTPYEDRPHHLRESVLVGFSAIQEDQISEGINRLKAAWFGA
ncbi:MAG: PLP-dependent aminotransferase family protein [Coriobacteriales bacterium]|nr:PLP-dependent aminotransferase family protein [Coriobacteriales bacterium]